MSYPGKGRWPKWPEVLEAWSDYDVSEVEIRDFRIREQYPRLPWLNKETEKQLVDSSNPQIDTAFHLCTVLPSEPPELVAAYKIYAYCRENRIDEFANRVLEPVFRKAGHPLYSWWNPSARYVLPPIYGDRLISWHGRNSAKEWKLLIEDAAFSWRSIQEQWAVVRIPDWMDRGSPEYEAYSTYLDELQEKRDRASYEYLKRKFEGG